MQQVRGRKLFPIGDESSLAGRPKEVTVKLSDRIILSPFAAKRLATLLNNGIRDYEFRFGPLDAQSRGKYDPTMH